MECKPPMNYYRYKSDLEEKLQAVLNIDEAIQQKEKESSQLLNEADRHG